MCFIDKGVAMDTGPIACCDMIDGSSTANCTHWCPKIACDESTQQKRGSIVSINHNPGASSNHIPFPNHDP